MKYILFGIIAATSYTARGEAILESPYIVGSQITNIQTTTKLGAMRGLLAGHTVYKCTEQVLTDKATIKNKPKPKTK